MYNAYHIIQNYSTYLCHEITIFTMDTCLQLDLGKIVGQNNSYITMKKYPDIKFSINYLSSKGKGL